MMPSDIIAQSYVCREAAIRICPHNHDELFQTVWLNIKERELSEPDFNPNDPKRYFIRALKNQKINWDKSKQYDLEVSKIDETKIITFESDDIPCEAFLEQWMDEPTTDEDCLFLKNITTLAINSNNNKSVIDMIGISKRQYYFYKKIAKEKLYDDYYATNNDHVHSPDMV